MRNPPKEQFKTDLEKAGQDFYDLLKDINKDLSDYAVALNAFKELLSLIDN